MKRLKALLTFLAGIAFACAPAFATDQPHFIFVMADDMGWGQAGYRGHPVLKTPNRDAMAANGDSSEIAVAEAVNLLGKHKAHQPHLAKWKDRWEYSSYTERAEGSRVPGRTLRTRAMNQKPIRTVQCCRCNVNVSTPEGKPGTLKQRKSV